MWLHTWLLSGGRYSTSPSESSPPLNRKHEGWGFPIEKCLGMSRSSQGGTLKSTSGRHLGLTRAHRQISWAWYLAPFVPIITDVTWGDSTPWRPHRTSGWILGSAITPVMMWSTNGLTLGFGGDLWFWEKCRKPSMELPLLKERISPRYKCHGWYLVFPQFWGLAAPYCILCPVCWERLSISKASAGIWNPMIPESKPNKGHPLSP